MRLREVISNENEEEIPEDIREFLYSDEGKKLVSVYHSEKRKALWELTDKGYEALAWTGNIRGMFYNKEKGILITETEGDIDIYVNPSEEFLKQELQEYPKGEISLGEKYDPRFQGVEK